MATGSKEPRRVASVKRTQRSQKNQNQSRQRLQADEKEDPIEGRVKVR
jgi:hypothetical protein